MKKKTGKNNVAVATITTGARINLATVAVILRFYNRSSAI